jgi:hypothetical protein
MSVLLSSLVPRDDHLHLVLSSRLQSSLLGFSWIWVFLLVSCNLLCSCTLSRPVRANQGPWKGSVNDLLHLTLTCTWCCSRGYRLRLGCPIGCIVNGYCWGVLPCPILPDSYFGFFLLLLGTFSLTGVVVADTVFVGLGPAVTGCSSPTDILKWCRALYYPYLHWLITLAFTHLRCFLCTCSSIQMTCLCIFGVLALAV